MIQNGVLLMEKSLAHNSVCRRDMLCGTDGSPTSHQTVPRLLPAWHEVGVLFRTHFVTFLPENLSSYEKKASVNRSMPMKRTVHDVTTAYVAETAAGVLRAGIKDCPEISTGCEQIAPEHLRDMNPVKHEKIPDKRQFCPSFFKKQLCKPSKPAHVGASLLFL